MLRFSKRNVYLFAGYTLIVFLQYCSMRQTVIDSEVTTQIANRPWLTVARTDYNPLNDAMVQVTLTNTGNSPALRIAIVHCLGHYTATPADIPCKGDLEALGRGFLGRMDATDLLDSARGDNVVNQAIINGDPALYAFGRIQYFDMFKKEHWTTYCYLKPLNEQRFKACDKHNELK